MSRRALAAVVATLACLPAAAAVAGPTVGVAFGKSQASADADSGTDPNTTVGLFARGQLSRLLSIQAEVTKLQTDPGYGYTMRSYNIAGILDLTNRGRLIPFVLLGVGLDTSSPTYEGAVDNKYTHAELGGGVEYRFAGGFVLGADVRLGSRSNGSEGYAEPGAGGGIEVAHYVASTSLAEGQYRSARLTLGVHF